MRTWLLIALFAGACGGRQAPARPAEITCEQFADRGVELVLAGFDAEFAHLEPEERAARYTALGDKIRPQLVSDCNTANWSQPGRQCVIDAPTLEAARACEP